MNMYNRFRFEFLWTLLAVILWPAGSINAQMEEPCGCMTSVRNLIHYNIQVIGDEKPLESDLYNRSMLISSSEANIGKEYLDIFYEINDRLSYNLDKDYLTTKENIRGLVIEMQNFLNKDTDDLV